MLEQCKSENKTETLRYISKAMPFIIEPFEDSVVLEISSEDKQVDLPFSTCSFELSDGACFWGRRPDVTEDSSISMICIVAFEIHPQEVAFSTYGRFGKEGDIKVWFFSKERDPALWALMNMHVETCLQRLRDGQHGHTSPRAVFKWKEAGEKKQVRINKVIHVRPRTATTEPPISTRNIIWSHAFWVMGHWRNISGIGKDRSGVYGVSGKTWVIPHVRNEELGDPVTKIRFSKQPIVDSL